MSQLHLATGSGCPPLQKGKLRLYNMIFCPYARRACLVLAHKQIPHEVVNVNLKNKPEWLFDKNPAGLVPTLEQDDKLIVESEICMEYLDQEYPGVKLYPSDAYEKARVKMKMASLGKFTSAIFGILLTNDEEIRKDKLPTYLSELEKVDQNLLTGPYFNGEELSAVDYFIWPFFEMLQQDKIILGYDTIDKDTHPKLHAWRAKMLATSVVKETMISGENHHKFLQAYNAKNQEYDFLFKK